MYSSSASFRTGRRGHSFRNIAYSLLLAILLSACSLTFLVVARHYLTDLAESARTYATFYPYLSRHPQTVFQYQGVDEATSLREPVVPQTIHQIWLTEGRDTTLTKYEAAISSCKSLHPNWTHNIWTDESASSFIAEHYPGILPHYNGYDQSIQRTNILRYALLDHFGGVYLDLDVTCLQPLDDLRTLPFLTPGAHPAGVNNAFILSRPQHPFWRNLLSEIGNKDLKWGLPYVENMLSAGCMFFSNRWMNYARSFAELGTDQRWQDRVNILGDEYGHLESHMLRGATTTPLFQHGGASSWHGWDAAAIVFVGAHLRNLLAVISCLSVLILLAGWFYKRRSENRRRDGYLPLVANPSTRRKNWWP